MGLDLWKIKYEKLQDHITDEEYNFLEKNSATQDDGNFYIDEYMLKDALAETKKEEISKIQDLLDTLREEFKKEGRFGISFNLG